MNFVQRIKHHPRILVSVSMLLMSAGMLILALAIAWPQHIGGAFGMNDSQIDGARGCLFGLSIGFNLWSVFLLAHNRHDSPTLR